jgi:hypothetical protein
VTRPQDDLPALTFGPDTETETAEQQRRYAQRLLDLTNRPYPARARCFPQGEPVREARAAADAAAKLFVVGDSSET